MLIHKVPLLDDVFGVQYAVRTSGMIGHPHSLIFPWNHKLILTFYTYSDSIVEHMFDHKKIYAFSAHSVCECIFYLLHAEFLIYWSSDHGTTYLNKNHIIIANSIILSALF